MILHYLLLFAAFSGVITFFVSFVGANLYDLKQIKVSRQQMLHPNSLRYRRRPIISVIIPTHNDESAIIRCLESIKNSNYRNLEIIVADNASEDGTKSLVRKFIANNPKRNIKLYAKRKNSSRLEAISNAHKYYSHGKIVVLFENAACTVDKFSVSKIAMRFNSEDELNVLNVNYKVRAAYSTAGLFQEFGLLLRSRNIKSGSVFNVGYLPDSKGAVAYSNSVFAKLIKSKSVYSPNYQLGNEVAKSVYASDVTVYGEAQSFFGIAKDYYRSQIRRLNFIIHGFTTSIPKRSNNQSLLEWLYIPFAAMYGLLSLVIPILLTYFTYLAISLHEPALLIISWASMGIYLFFVIWEDEQLSFWSKTRYVSFIPITFGWFYLMSFMHFLVLLTSFRAFPKISRA